MYSLFSIRESKEGGETRQLNNRAMTIFNIGESTATTVYTTVESVPAASISCSCWCWELLRSTRLAWVMLHYSLQMTNQNLVASSTQKNFPFKFSKIKTHETLFRQGGGYKISISDRTDGEYLITLSLRSQRRLRTADGWRAEHVSLPEQSQWRQDAQAQELSEEYMQGVHNSHSNW